eukprot:TRINITY_DN82675_c0_g1_i1.p1 TRINITY_DN82675_c0_g1~~TRINITY_DN82675_c0_g1_i1.p1  ORF type:complete len:285 (-),score=93.48 TRINITY_DN82675_c0_g1_i1:94-948(-)
MQLVGTSLLVLAGAGVASALGISGRSPAALRSDRQSQAASFVRSLEFKQNLRICNAYPYDSGVSISVGKEELSSSPVPYKTCSEYSPKMNAGDKVDFKVDGNSVGTFTISDLPESDATLVMVIYRHDTMSTAVSFESHIFASTSGTQVAVIDTYKGKSASELRIEDVKPADKHKEEKNKHSFVARSEMLRYNNVVAVNPGVYKVRLMEEGQKSAADAELVAVQKENYVILRVGVQAEEGKAYPEELVVFPHSDKKIFESAAASLSGLRLWLLAVAAALAPLLLA